MGLKQQQPTPKRKGGGAVQAENREKNAVNEATYP